MEVKNFGVLTGENVKFEKGHIILTDPALDLKDGEESVAERVLTQLRSDVVFSSGIIELKFKTNSFDTGILILFNTQDGGGLSMGLSKLMMDFSLVKAKEK